jgi:hypothetical protein
MEIEMAEVMRTTPSEPVTGKITDAEAAAMVRAVFGHPSQSTYYRWKRGKIGAIPHDTVWRLGDLMGIHKALRYMFTEPARGYAWVSKPNAALGGRSALDRMLGGAPSDISAVRAYLDAERGGW